MALFEIVFELPAGCSAADLGAAVDASGFEGAQVRPEDSQGAFSVTISHISSKFETGITLADAIIFRLPEGSKYLSHRLAASIQEMSAEDLDELLNEIKNSNYGSSM